MGKILDFMYIYHTYIYVPTYVYFTTIKKKNLHKQDLMIPIR